MSSRPPPLRDPEPLTPPDYPLHTGEPLLRELDPTEWNMERLNRVSNGAGCVYQLVRGRGPLRVDDFRASVGVLTERHPLLGARIVRMGDDARSPLAYVRGTEGPAIAVVRTQGLDTSCRAIIEADMNAGPSPCWRTSPFRIALIEDTEVRDAWALIVAGPHAHCDGISLAGIAHELLALLGGDQLGPPLPLASIHVPHATASMSDGDATPPVSPRMVAPEEKVPGTPERASVVRTGLLEATLDREATASLIDAVKSHGITVHGAIGAAVHLAHAERHAKVTGDDAFGTYRAGTPVSMRPHLDPPLSSADLRMAVDVALTDTRVGPEDTFWQLASRFGGAIREQIRTGAILQSWNRTERKDRHAGSTGVPLLLISNVGRSEIRPRYGDLEIHAVAGSMATHGMFQINMLFTTFDGRLGGTFYFEEPTVSRESMRAFVERVVRILGGPKVHDGDPTVAELLRAPV
ncbi:MAG: phthiocerol/phthiodiolone dimycocerosyl transferase family protein [Myxococcota bacterium]